jgi:hypothetical protein
VLYYALPCYCAVLCRALLCYCAVPCSAVLLCCAIVLCRALLCYCAVLYRDLLCYCALLCCAIVFNRTDVDAWSVADVGDWLASMLLQQHAAKFANNAISGPILLEVGGSLHFSAVL